MIQHKISYENGLNCIFDFTCMINSSLIAPSAAEPAKCKTQKHNHSSDIQHFERHV